MVSNICAPLTGGGGRHVAWPIVGHCWMIVASGWGLVTVQIPAA
jgi:hypothetical protein